MLRHRPAPWKRCPAAGSYPQPRRSSSPPPLPYPLPLHAIYSPGQALYRCYPPPWPPLVPPLTGAHGPAPFPLQCPKSSTPEACPPHPESPKPDHLLPISPARSRNGIPSPPAAAQCRAATPDPPNPNQAPLQVRADPLFTSPKLPLALMA